VDEEEKPRIFSILSFGTLWTKVVLTAPQLGPRGGLPTGETRVQTQ
jgi:hypothetical protein